MLLQHSDKGIVGVQPNDTETEPSATPADGHDPAEWVDLYGDALYRFALARVNDVPTAEDLVQETFLAAIKGRGRFKSQSTRKTWLMGILKHKIVDHLRRKYREPVSTSVDNGDEALDHLFNTRGHWQVKPAVWAQNPSKIIEQKEFLDIFYRCLGEMPSRLADVFLKREIDGLPTDALCKILNITATNSWVMLYRARMRLRRCLEVRWLSEKNT